MIRHHAFFETLGDIEADSPAWHSAFAGLSVLRLIDRISAGDDSDAPVGWHDLETSSAAIERVNPGDPARSILGRILDRIKSTNRIDAEVGSELVTYARALERGGKWALARDVLDSVLDTFRESQNLRLVLEASTLLGAVARSSGDWKASERSYARAEHLAESINDRAAALRVREGMANSLMIRGNLVAAEEELDRIIEEARAIRSQQAEASALHSKASVAHLKGNYQETIHLAYRSLELTIDPAARERVLADIAAAYAGLGMRETARNGYSIVAVTSPHQWVRWQSMLNLMELAILDDDEKSFDEYASELESAAFDPRLKAYFMFFKAEGSRRFNRPNAEALFDEARAFAERHQLHQLAFEIEAAIANAVPSATPTGELAEVAEVLEHLRAQSAG